jgi:hypothetical protein
LDHGSISIKEDKEREALKVDKFRESHPSGSGEQENPSKYINNSWFKMTMDDS